WNTFMCGQIAYDWNTMPKLRRLGAMNTLLAEEYTVVPLTEIRPDLGRSSPAMERSVVVLPQPLGPSSVNSLPSGTSKQMSCAALTVSPFSLGYSVYRFCTLNMICLQLEFVSRFSSGFFDAEALAQELSRHHQQEESDDEHDAQGGKLDILAVFPQLPDHDRDDLGAGAVQQDGGGQFAYGHDDD